MKRGRRDVVVSRHARSWHWVALVVVAALVPLIAWRLLSAQGVRSAAPQITAEQAIPQKPNSAQWRSERERPVSASPAQEVALADFAPHRSLENASIDELLAVLASQGDPAERMDALTILRDLDEREAFERALAALADPDSGVRAVAADQLGRSDDRRAFSPLNEALEREPVREVRETIAAALIELDPSYDDQGAGGQRGEAVRNRHAGMDLLLEHAPGLDVSGVVSPERDSPPTEIEPAP